MKRNAFLILFLIFTLSACGSSEDTSTGESSVKYVTTEIVKEGTFSENLRLPGKVSASKETAISSLASGIIKTINVNVGDQVKAGDILATVDTNSNLVGVGLNNAVNSYNNAVAAYNATKTSLDKGVETAKLQYDNAKLNRDNIYINTEKQLELAKTQYNSAVTQKGNTANTSTTTLELAEKSLENAKLSLNNFTKNSEETLNTLSVKKDSIIKNIKVAIEGSFVSFDTSLTEVDKILGVSDLNRRENDAYEMYLSSKNSQYKAQAVLQFENVLASFNDIKSKYISNFPDQDLLSYQDNLLNVVNENIVLLEKMIVVFNNTTPSTALSESSIAGMRNGILGFQSQFIALKGNLTNLTNGYQDIINTISSTKTSLATQKNSLEQGLQIAEATYNNTKSNINTGLDNVSSAETTAKIQYETAIESVRSARETADNNLKISENQYNAAKANYNAQLANIKAQVDGASGQKNSFSQQFENSLIKAPYDGVIISKNIEIGSTVGQGSITFMIANSLGKVIKIDVNSENIKHLGIGKSVKIAKGGIETTGNISLLGAGVNTMTSMYPVEVAFNDEAFGNSVVLGDFVDVYIEKDLGNMENIVIPFSSLIVHSNGKYSVFLVSEEGVAIEQNVEIGSSNSNEVLVLSGIKVGDKIVTSGALNLYPGDKVEEK